MHGCCSCVTCGIFQLKQLHPQIETFTPHHSITSGWQQKTRLQEKGIGSV